MNTVVIISKDPSFFHSSGLEGDLISRHLGYGKELFLRDASSKLTIFAPTKNFFQKPFSIENVKFVPIKSYFRLGYLFFGTISVLRETSLNGCKTVTCQTPFEDFYLAFLVSKLFKSRLIVQLHFDLFSKHWLEERLFNGILKRLALKSLCASDIVRVVSSSQKNAIIDNLSSLEEKIRICPVPVSITNVNITKQTFQMCVPQTKRVCIGFIGIFYEPKNLHFWVDVAEQLAINNAEVDFCLWGDGPLTTNIKEYVKKKSVLEGRFFFKGRFPYQDIQFAYSAIDIFLLTSFYEGFGRVLVESGLMKLPAVSSDSGGPSDIILNGVTGFLIEGFKIDSYVEKLERLTKNSALRKKFGEAAYKRCSSNFSQEKITTDLIDIWLED